MNVGFVEENGGRGAIMNNITTGYVTVFPRGLIHFEQNLSCRPATFISALDNEDPGVITVSVAEFDLPDEALASAFNVPISEVQKLRAGLPISPSKGIKECYRRCGIKNY